MIVEEAWSVFIVVYLCGCIVAGLNCFCCMSLLMSDDSRSLLYCEFVMGFVICQN